MPIHYIERARLAEQVAKLEQSGEEIVAVVAEGDNFQVFTARRRGGIEKRDEVHRQTRPASGAGR